MKRFFNPSKFSIGSALALLGLAICLAGGLTGCGSATTNKADTATSAAEHSPENFSEGLQKLVSQKTRIQTAFEKSDPDSAHDDLHEIGHVLESLPALAKKSGIAEADLPAVKEAVDSLFDAFGKLDENLHGGDETPYKDVAEKIDTAIAALNKMVTK